MRHLSLLLGIVLGLGALAACTASPPGGSGTGDLPEVGIPSGGDGGGLPDGQAAPEAVSDTEPATETVEPMACEEPAYPACSTGDNCDSGYCVEGPAGLECTETCETKCPCGYACRTAGGGDPSYICIYDHLAYCMPCISDADCTHPLTSAAKGYCLPGGPGVESFCATACAGAGSCPSGAVCAEVAVGDGAVSACLPDAGEACTCSPFAAAQGASTECSVTNQAGTCLGERSCTGERLSACDAPEPAVEVCDGVDNDCDGETDGGLALTLPDGTEVAAVGAACGAGVCLGGVTTCNAQGDGLACTTLAKAVAELCDALDNDCDGSTDEELTLTQPDGSQVTGLGQTCGLGACAGGTTECEAGTGAMVCSSAGLATEEVCDGQDNDCDGLVDADDAGLARPLCEKQGGVCAGLAKPAGLCDGGQWGGCGAEVYQGYAPTYAGDLEVTCDGVDEDCDGTADEDFELAMADGTVIVGVGLACGAGACSGGLTVCNAAKSGVFCSSAAGAGVETCDGLDNDCDGVADGADPDLVLAPCEKAGGVCVGALHTADQCLGGGGWAACSEEQYQAHSALYEAAESDCDKLDTDCDGLTDAADPDLAQAVVLCENQKGVCDGAAKPASLCAGGQWSSCSAPVYLGHHGGFQGGLETACDELDNDCDGSTDEDFVLTQADGSTVTGAGKTCGIGGCAGGKTSCNGLANGLVCSSDGGAQGEVCDGEDNDCDGLVDAKDPTLTLTACSNQTGVCSGAKHVASQCVGGNWQACTDAEYKANASTYGAEKCDGLDNDCKSGKDPDGSTNCQDAWKDGDNDSYGDPNQHACQCVVKSDYETNDLDCWDGSAEAKPQSTVWKTTKHGGGTYDWNCNGVQEKRWPSKVGECKFIVDLATGEGCQPDTAGGAPIEGWSSSVPACGDDGTWHVYSECQWDWWTWTCQWNGSSTETQACR